MARPDPETVPGTKQWHGTSITSNELREPVSPYYAALFSASGWPKPLDIGRNDLVGLIDYGLDFLNTLDRLRGELFHIVDGAHHTVLMAWRLPTIDDWWFAPWLAMNVIPFMNRDALTIDLLLRMNENEFEHIHRKDIEWWKDTYKSNPKANPNST